MRSQRQHWILCVALAAILWLAAVGEARQEPLFQTAEETPASDLKRFDLDVTGDGVAEVFLTTGDTWTRSGSTWTGYAAGADGAFKPFGVLVFHPDYLRVDTNPRRIVVLEPVDLDAFRRVEYALVEGRLVRLGARELSDAPGDDQGGELARERALTASYCRDHPAVVSFARPEDSSPGGGEPVWRDPRTGRPRAGLRKLTGGPLDVTTAPAVRLALAKDLIENRTCFPEETCEVDLVELDVTGDGKAEVFLAAAVTASQLGWRVYTPVAGEYRLLGEVPFEPLCFRFDTDSGSLVVVDDRAEEVVTYRVGAQIERVRRASWREDYLQVGRPERDRIKAFQASGVAKILRAPWREFVAAPDKVTWTSWITGKPETPTVDLTATVVGQ